MKPLILLLMTGVFGCSHGHQCNRMDNLPHLYKNSRLDAKPFLIVPASGPMTCVRNCKLYSLCKWADFNEDIHSCSLFVRRENMISNQNYISMDIDEWDDEILENCKNHQCANNTICKPNVNGFNCELVGCINIPIVENMNMTSFLGKALWKIGETVEYACNRGYFTHSNAKCTSSGSWSNFTCNEYTTCSDLSICSVARDGEYWLRGKIFQSRRKIFCRNDASAWLTLIEYNMASTPEFRRPTNSCEKLPSSDPVSEKMGYTDYQKIAVDISTGKVKVYLSKYSNSTFFKQNYGKAGDCYTGSDSKECGILGKFIIDIRGTGVRFQSTIEFTTYNNGVKNITRSDDGLVIIGSCGGNCGGCESKNLFLEDDPNYTPPFNSAELPICRLPRKT